MLKRVARFRKLKAPTADCPTARCPSAGAGFSVIGFQPPMSDNAAPLAGRRQRLGDAGDLDRRRASTSATAKQDGQGPAHAQHDTNETFIPMTGRWRCEWNEGDAMEYVDLDPFDVISFRWAWRGAS